MWPHQTPHSSLKQYYVTILVALTTIPILADLVTQFSEDTIVFSNINESLVALSALCSVVYVSACFIGQKKEVVALVQELGNFEDHSSRKLILETDKSVKFYTKLFIVYGIVGNICYGLLPVLDYNECQRNRPDRMVKTGIPCGLVVSFLLPFRYDYSPLYEVVAVYEVVVCILCTTVIIVISMLICGILIHITTQLKCLKRNISNLSKIEDSTVLEKKMKSCVKYHILITDYATRADSAFGQIMLLHITWTGFVISILGFEIATTTDIVVAVRFFLHLLGWLGMLFLVCYYGQSLMDESLGIADAIYSFSWYTKEVLVQKYVVLILLRSQKALTLRAAGMKVMSLATFLGVLYSAYSYFTLLLKLN